MDFQQDPTIYLETISIHDSLDLKHIRVGGRALNLKHFEIVGCRDVKSINLSDFDQLVSFPYKGQALDLRLDNLPTLKVVDMRHGHEGLINNNRVNVFGQISSCSSSLHTLSINMYFSRESFMLNFVPQLLNPRNWSCGSIAVDLTVF